MLDKLLLKIDNPKPKRERPASMVSGQADLLAESVEPAPAALPPHRLAYDCGIGGVAG